MDLSLRDPYEWSQGVHVFLNPQLIIGQQSQNQTELSKVHGAGLRARSWSPHQPLYVTLGNFLSLGLDLLHYKRRGYEDGQQLY